MLRNKICTILLFFLSFCIYAQTGIGVYDVNPNAALHIEAPLGDKGIIIPRLTTQDRDKIKVDNTDENGLTIYNTDEGCFNYWSIIEKKWKSVCGQLGKAKFEILDCQSDVKVYGLYKSKESVNLNHYVTVKVNVTKKGTYHIVGITDDGKDNGYYFSGSGEFLSLGTYTLKIPAMGQPRVAQKDKLTLLLNGEKTNGNGPACSFEITVEDSDKKPAFRMDCSNTKVYGVYLLNQPLTQSNFISVKIKYSAEAIGSTYIIETDELDGIKFKGQGKVTNPSLEQDIILYGEGAPYTTDLKRVIIRSNSSITTGVCYANVRIAIPKKKILSIGNSKNGYGYNFSGTAASNKLIREPLNYGTDQNSVISFEGWSEIKDGTSNPSTADLRTWLLGNAPYDIVILGYSWGPNVEQADIMMEYLIRGGVILAFSENKIGMTNLLRLVTSNNSLNIKNGFSAGSLYVYSAVDDMVLNGPFGDVRGQMWGEDASATSVALNMDTSAVYVYSDSFDKATDKSPSVGHGITAFKHRVYNLIWVGDGGFNSNHTGTSNTICPFKLNSNNFPIEKQGYGNTTTAKRKAVYNSIFTANAIGWALNQAEQSGINSNKK